MALGAQPRTEGDGSDNGLSVLRLTAGAVFLAGLVLTIRPIDAPWAGLLRTLGCHVPVLLGAWSFAGVRARRSIQPPVSSYRLLLAAYIYFVGLIGVGLILGVAGRLTPFMAIVSAGILATVMFAGAGGAGVLLVMPRRRPLAQIAVLGLLVLVVCLIAWRALAEPNYDYDVLTYHLMFPARWIQEQGISIVPTWCGDPSPAYSPLASEVFYTWLLLPMGDDTLARCGQFPFWLLLLVATACLAREMKLRPVAGMILVLLLAVVPALADQSRSAMVDVALAAHLVATVFFTLRMCRRPTRHDLTGLCLAAGLLLATKFLAIAYVVAFMPLFVLQKWRSRRRMKHLLTCPGVILAMLAYLWIGGFWYARNLIVTGNPVYPIQVEVGSTVLFEGAYGRAQMENSPFNVRRRGEDGLFTRTLRDALHVPETLRPELRPSSDEWVLRRWYFEPFGLIGMVFIVAAVVTIGRPAGDALRWLLFYLSVVLAFGCFWFVLPFQQPRFLWGPFVLMLCGACRVFRGGRWIGLPALGFATIVWTRQFSTEITHILAVSAIGWIGVVVIVGGFALMLRVRRGARYLPIAATVAMCIFVLAAGGVSSDARTRAFENGRWRFIAPAWDWIDRELHGVTIAYVGNNVPYFLAGRKLENKVIYVPARRPMRGRFHDYAATPEALALGPPNTSEPVVDRYVMDPLIWLDNLQRLNVDYVVVSQLFPNLLVNIRHDADGFPIERQWLDALVRPIGSQPPMAHLRVLANGAVRLYRLDLPDELDHLPPMPSIVRDETDAIGRLYRDSTPPSTPIRNYPLARPNIDGQSFRRVSP